MLDRRYIVPEILEGEEEVAVDQKDPGTTEHAGVEKCIERLSQIKEEVNREVEPEQKIELELETLFSSADKKNTASEMEMVVVLLCKIAHRIIRSKKTSEENEMVLLQIFELGLFMVQFKNRWLGRLEETGIMEEQGWVPSENYSSVTGTFVPVIELVKLAQEHMLRKERIKQKRSELCAFCLANSLGAHSPSISLLLKQKKEAKGALGEFFFVAAVFADSRETRGRVLLDWAQSGITRIDSKIFYIPEIEIVKFFRSEINKLSDAAKACKIISASGSHALLCSCADLLTSFHREGVLRTEELAEVVVNTCSTEESEKTFGLFQALHSYSPEVAESVAKSLIILRRTDRISELFYAMCSTVDKEYVECATICSRSFHLIPRERLVDLYLGEYFPFVCGDARIFKELVRRVSQIYEESAMETKEGVKRVRHAWDLFLFADKIFTSLPVTKETLEKALIITMYFPWMLPYVKQCIWKEADAKGVQIRISKKDSAEEVLEVLSCFRDVPRVASALKRICRDAKEEKEAELALNREIDAFAIGYIRKTVSKMRKTSEVKKIWKFAADMKEREQLQHGTYWVNVLKKQIRFGKVIPHLCNVMSYEDVLGAIDNEEDIIRLLEAYSKTCGNREISDPFFVVSLLEKLELQSRYERGLVLGASSFILVPVDAKKLTVYASMVQKEFSGRQTLVKLVSDSGTALEVYINNGKGKISHTTRSGVELEESIEEIEEEFEKNPAGGWKVAVALTATPKESTLKIGETEIVLKKPLKKIRKVVIGEGFKGILKRALLIEEPKQSADRMSAKPRDAFFLDVLLDVERQAQYHKRFALLIDSQTPYTMYGEPPKVVMCNVIEHIPKYWRASERASRIVARISAKDAIIEQKVMSYLAPQDTFGFRHFAL